MIEVKVKWRRLPKQIAEDARKRVERALQQSAEEGAEVARQLAPYRTGHLHDSIAAWPVEGKLEWDIIAAASYALFVEYGTEYMLAQPFLTPALQMAKRNLRERIAEAVGDLFK